MFWIPVMFIAACMLGARVLAHRGMEAAEKTKHDNWQRQYEDFRSRVEPDRELAHDVRQRCASPEFCAVVVQCFVGDDSPDWKTFAFKKPEAARMILLAQQGKMESPASGFRSPTYTPGAKLGIEPPWRGLELTERFLLLLEDELKKHGVEVTAVANYGSEASGNFKYYPVRDYVARYGYAREGYVSFSTVFRWAQCLEHNVASVD